MSAHLERGRILYQQDRHQDAVGELQRELAEDPQSAEAHALLALALCALERPEPALERARAAVALNPEWSFTHHVLARVHLDADRHDQALAAIDQALRVDPGDAEHHALRAAILLSLRRTEDALRAAERALALDAEHVGALNLRSMALVRLGRRAEAQAGIDVALAADPDSPTSHANRGWTFLHASDPRAALLHFSEALRLDPANRWARQGLIEALKARNPVYRAILAWYLLADRISTGRRWMLILGFLVVSRVLRDLLRRDERLVPLAVLVAVLYAATIWLTWVAVPLFDLMLYCDRLGRHALPAERKRSAQLFGGSLVLAAALSGALLALGHGGEAALYAVAGLALGIPLSALTQMDAGARRTATAVFVVVLAAALVFGFLLRALGLAAEDQAPSWVALGVMLACGASTWAIGLSERG